MKTQDIINALRTTESRSKRTLLDAAARSAGGKVMERLTSAEVRVDASVDGMIGPLVDLTNLKPKLLNMILNGPTLNGVSKDMLRQIIRQLYSELAAYEDTGLEPAMCANYKTFEDEAISKGVPFKRIVELMEADKDGRLVVLPCDAE